MNVPSPIVVRLRRMLYAVCVATDFAAFVVIFAVSRRLAEAGCEPWYLGVAGAGVSFCAGVGSILGGWLAHRVNGRAVFLSGAALLAISIGCCAAGDIERVSFLPGYWLLGIGLGFLYPPLIGWLNQDEDAHANRTGVSRVLIVYCIAWNLGMMCGQLTAGELFARGASWAYAVSGTVALMNVLLALVAARMVLRLPLREAAVAERDERQAARAAAFQRLGWIANLGGMFGGSMVVHLLPDLAVTIGVPAESHGQLLAVWRAVIIATYLAMHGSDFWQFRFGVSLVSQLLAAAGLLAIASAESAPMLLAGLALLGQLVGFNYFSGLYYSTAGSRPEGRALAAGIHEATLAAGMAVGTILGGMLGTWVNHRVPYVLAAGVMATMLGAQVAARRLQNRRAQAQTPA